MARKKSASSKEVAEKQKPLETPQESQERETSEERSETSKKNDEIVNPVCTDEVVNPVCTDEVVNPVCSDEVVNPVCSDEVVNPALMMTGIVNVDASFEDPDVLSRLQSGLLPSSALYREAQRFAAQNLDVDQLMHSGDPILIRNLAEILRLCDRWDSRVLRALLIDDEKVQASLERYTSHVLRSGCVDPMSFVRALAALADQIQPERLSSFCLKTHIDICIAEKNGANLDEVLAARVKLFAFLDERALRTLLFDASSLVRVATLKSMLLKPQLSTSLLSIALILLRENDDKVTIALVRVIARFTPCPELVIPALIDVLCTSSPEVVSEIVDALRGYGDAAVHLVMEALAATDENAFNAARILIQKSPQRYTDPLLRALRSLKTPEHVKNRVIDILKNHPDEARHEEIMKEVDKQLRPVNFERPEWVAPSSEVKFLEKACQHDDVYQRLLDDGEIEALKNDFDEPTLTRLLNDANEVVQRNALHLIKASQKASPALVFNTTVWFKAASFDLARDAIETYLAYETNLDTALKTLINAFHHMTNEDVRNFCFDLIARDQNRIDALMVLYDRHPSACTVFVKKFLRNNPSQKTIKAFLDGLHREHGFNCVEATIAILLDVDFVFDNTPIRATLIEHVVNPMSRGQRGLILRFDCLKLLQRYLSRDEKIDKTTIASLQNIYKTIKNSEIQKLARETLCALDQEIFDDDEDDDFDDLKGDDE